MSIRSLLILLATLSTPAFAADAVDAPALMKRAGPSVALVACRGEVGVGVLFRDRRHLLTAYALAWSGREVDVTFADGTTLEGATVHTDRETGVAVVRLERDAPADPLPLASGRPAVGDPIAVLGRQRDWENPQGGGTATAVAGRVAGIGDEDLRIDATVGPTDTGAAVLDAQGNLLGIAWSEGAGLVPVIPAEAAAKAPEDDDPIFGEWVFAPASGIMLGVSDDQTMTKGLYSGFRLVGGDLLQFDLGLSVIYDDDVPFEDETLIERDRVGFVVDTLAGYRVSLLPSELGPMHLTLSAGASLHQYGGVLRTLGADGTIVRTEIDESFARPTLGFGLLMLGVIEMKYLWDINTDDLGASSHRIGIGVAF